MNLLHTITMEMASLWFRELCFVLLLIQRERERERQSDEFASHRSRKQRGRPSAAVGPEVTLNNVDSHKSKFGTGGDCDIEEEQAARERASILKTREDGRRGAGRQTLFSRFVRHYTAYRLVFTFNLDKQLTEGSSIPPTTITA